MTSSSLQDRLLYPSIPVAFVDDTLLAARYRGLDVESLLVANGLSTSRLQVPGARVSIEQYSRVLRDLRRLSDDAFMGFLSRPLPPDSFRVFAYSVVGCRNLQEFVDQANAFYGLLSDDFSWQLEDEHNSLRLVVKLQPALPVDYRFIIQSLMLMSIRQFGWLLGEDVEPISLGFTFTARETDENLAYLFGKRIEFGADSNYIDIDRSYGKATLSSNRDQVASMLKSTRHLFLVSRHKYRLSQEIRRRLLLTKSEAWLEVGQVAAQLGIDKHQLWRKLKKEGTNFLDIRNQVKRDWALQLLEEPANTVEQVADILRYGDVSAFRKAFKKWTGVQPMQYREKLFS